MIQAGLMVDIFIIETSDPISIQNIIMSQF